MKNKFFSNQSGQSLFEVMYAFVLITLVIVAIVGLAIVSIRNSSYAKDNTQAQKYAEEAMEWFRRERDAGNWMPLYNNKTGKVTEEYYCLPVLDQEYKPGFDLFKVKEECDKDEETHYISSTKFLREISLLQDPTYEGEVSNKDRIKVKVTVRWSDAKGDHNVTLTTYLVKPS